jgi:hypothetical protein
MYALMSFLDVLTLGSMHSFSPDYKMSLLTIVRNVGVRWIPNALDGVLEHFVVFNIGRLEDQELNAHTTCHLVAFVPVCIILVRRLVDLRMPCIQSSFDVAQVSFCFLFAGDCKHQFPRPEFTT